MAAVIRTLDADLVLMPETENLATLQMMADESLADLGYEAVLVDGRDSFTGQDVGLLSRFPVEASGRIDDRVAVGVSDALYGVSKNLWARLTLPDGTPVTVVGVHFLARPDDVDRRPRREAQAEVDPPVRRGGGGERPPADRAGRLQRPRRRRPGPRRLPPDHRRDGDGQAGRAGPGRRPGQRDRRRAAGPSGSRRSTTATATASSTSGEFSAIDHVLLSPALYRRVVDVRYVHAHDPREVSDHFPIVVTLGD